VWVESACGGDWAHGRGRHEDFSSPSATRHFASVSERGRLALFLCLGRFHHVINSDEVFGTLAARILQFSAAMFGPNASERCVVRSHSAVDNGPPTVDVLLELTNGELLITDYALDEIAD